MRPTGDDGVHDSLKARRAMISLPDLGRPQAISKNALKKDPRRSTCLLSTSSVIEPASRRQDPTIRK